MKSVILLNTLLLLFSCVSSQCLSIPNFGDPINCQTAVTNCECATWTNNCENGWTRSHGTPQLYPYCITIGGKERCYFYAYMWSTGQLGEGIFTNITDGKFLAHHSYNIKMRIYTSGGSGSMNVFATNTLTQPSGFGSYCCGAPTPNIPAYEKQLIGTYSGVNNQWEDITFTFVADQDYSQIWIYPTGTSGQYDLNVMNLEVCLSCEGTIVYNQYLVPYNLSRAGNIYVGSTAGSGGFGTVSTYQEQTTRLFATNEIRLLPSFEAVVTTGSFSATTDNCSTLNPYRTITDPFEWIPIDSLNVPVTTFNESTTLKNTTIPTPNQFSNIQAFPSISNSGLLKITGNSDEICDLNIIVIDQLGRQVMTKRNTFKTNLINLDLGNLKNGLYYIQIKSAYKMTTKKIIINK